MARASCPGKFNLVTTQKVRMQMSSQSNPVVGATTLVSADPGKTPIEVGVELGGTLEFRNHSHEFPDF
jgi:hypothetical protein